MLVLIDDPNKGPRSFGHGHFGSKSFRVLAIPHIFGEIFHTFPTLPHILFLAREQITRYLSTTYNFLHIFGTAIVIYLSEDANELNVPQIDRKFHKEKGKFHKKGDEKYIRRFTKEK